MYFLWLLTILVYTIIYNYIHICKNYKQITRTRWNYIVSAIDIYNLETENSKISRGKALHKAAKASNMSIKNIVKKAGFSYPAFFLHTKNDNLDLAILARYSKAMGHSFAEEFPEISEYLMEDKAAYGKELSYKELLADRDKWKEKYFEMVERYNKLADKYNSVLEEEVVKRK